MNSKRLLEQSDARQEVLDLYCRKRKEMSKLYTKVGVEYYRSTMNALVKLGYTPEQAVGALDKIDKENNFERV